MEHVAISTPPSKANVDEIKSLPNGGAGAIAVHGRANSRKARERMILQLERAGLDHRIAATLGWSTSMPEPKRTGQVSSSTGPEPDGGVGPFGDE